GLQHTTRSRERGPGGRFGLVWGIFHTALVSARRAVAGRDVAAHATVRLIRKRAVVDQIAHEAFVTLYAVILQDAGILLMDADGLVKILQGKNGGMPEAVLGFLH